MRTINPSRYVSEKAGTNSKYSKFVNKFKKSNIYIKSKREKKKLKIYKYK